MFVFMFSVVVLFTCTGARGASDSTALSRQSALVLALAQDILTRLPALFDVEEVQARFPSVYDESMNTVLLQEVGRYNNLLGVVRKALQGLVDALQVRVFARLQAPPFMCSPYRWTVAVLS